MRQDSEEIRMIKDVDFHMHTEGMDIADLIERADEIGLEMMGISDHLNFERGTLEDVPENLKVFRRNRRYLEATEPPVPVFFGVEVHIMDTAGFHPLTTEIREEFRFDYTIGGLHGVYGTWTSHREIVDVCHKLLLRAMADPLLDVLAHPYWFPTRAMEACGLPMLPDLSMVPESYIIELAEVSRETDTALEVNACAIFSNPSYSDRFKKDYRGFLVALDDLGVTFSIGSDAHSVPYVGESRVAREVLMEIGVTEDRIWLPRPGGR